MSTSANGTVTTFTLAYGKTAAEAQARAATAVASADVAETMQARNSYILSLPPLPIPHGQAPGRWVGLRCRALFVTFVLFVLAVAPCGARLTTGAAAARAKGSPECAIERHTMCH